MEEYLCKQNSEQRRNDSRQFQNTIPKSCWTEILKIFRIDSEIWDITSQPISSVSEWKTPDGAVYYSAIYGDHLALGPLVTTNVLYTVWSFTVFLQSILTNIIFTFPRQLNCIFFQLMTRSHTLLKSSRTPTVAKYC